ncbi:hypothetical protein [Marinithermofilum abyssi]|nr:hypothetical protein [Marinithermofilum abyssi]
MAIPLWIRAGIGMAIGFILGVIVFFQVVPAEAQWGTFLNGGWFYFMYLPAGFVPGWLATNRIFWWLKKWLIPRPKQDYFLIYPVIFKYIYIIIKLQVKWAFAWFVDLVASPYFVWLIIRGMQGNKVADQTRAA